ncbi:MAG: hypothetical protein KGH49_01935 [Candidatus Micrarchaeota archaeon]|nr:hypothetical protein [Candidatus Micrarchaeota archaeon]
MRDRRITAGVLKLLGKSYIKLLPIAAVLMFRELSAASVLSLDIITTLSSVQQILSQVGPLLSAVLFIVAGIFYAVGQLLPPDKKANFHTTSVNIVIGAIVVAVLSVAANGLSLASTSLLSNITANSLK